MMESEGIAGKVNISEDTLNLLGKIFFMILFIKFYILKKYRH